MINPDQIADGFVAQLSDIPALVAELTGHGAAGVIIAYKDAFPGETNLRQAILQMPPGSILVAYIGTRPRRLSNSALLFQHQFSLFLRTNEGGSYGSLFALIMNGVPASGDGLALLHTPIDPGCYPMDLDLPSCSRNTIAVSADGATFDYLEVQVALTEIGG